MFKFLDLLNGFYMKSQIEILFFFIFFFKQVPHLSNNLSFTYRFENMLFMKFLEIIRYILLVVKAIVHYTMAYFNYCTNGPIIFI